MKPFPTLFAIMKPMNIQQKHVVVVGHPLSGKDTVGDYLAKEYGFAHVATGQLVRDYIAENHLGEPTRDLMQKTGNEVRRKLGSDYFYKKALDLNKSSDRLVINGIRTLGEVKAAKETGSIVIATVAPIEKRYEWAKARGRVSDKVSFADFVRQEEAESSSESPYEQNVNATTSLADYTIGNEEDLEHLYRSVDLLMSKLGVDKK